jgi:thiamine biosynthesis lipoprotein
VRIAALLLAACAGLAGTAHAEWIVEDTAVMGTAVHVRAWHEDGDRARAAVADALEVLHHVDATMSPYRADSDLSRVNDRAHLEPIAVGPELLEVLAHAAEVSELTAGAFDVTFASVGRFYDYREGRRPDASAIAAHLPSIDWNHVQLDRAAGTVAFAREGVSIDLGGIAKGYAVERAIARMRAHGIRNGQVTAGGDTRLLGDRVGRPWIIGIQDPRDETRLVTRIPLVDEAVATSGDYERYFEEDGIRYHHILDPTSGDSARKVRSVTIIGPDATFTDAFSTSVFVLGPEAGLAFIEARPGYEAVIVDGEGHMHFSTGLAPPGAQVTARTAP